MMLARFNRSVLGSLAPIIRRAAAAATVALFAGGAFGQGNAGDKAAHATGAESAVIPAIAADPGQGSLRPRPFSLRLPEPPSTATEYATGQTVQLEGETVWRPMCGSDLAQFTPADLLAVAQGHAAEMAADFPNNVTIVDQGLRGAGINIVFVLGSSVPAAAVPAFAAAESYLESLFSDPITVSVSVNFAVMQSGVLGSTGSSYVYTSYTSSRNGLVNGMDGNDTIQSWLPAGSTVPVRYNGNSATITNETRVFWTRANYNATVGFVSGSAASMTYNSTFGWDFDPSNGVSGYSFQDVIIHEVGHSLGFTSGADFRFNDLETLDLFRFQNTDGAGDYNPDSLAEFQVRPRLVDYNTPNDNHNSDLISATYRMSDGSPYQASHFREQSSPIIGLMDPALGFNQTFSPGFFTSADLNMFDAIGYSR